MGDDDDPTDDFDIGVAGSRAGCRRRAADLH
jgi:hypothetical protein